ncbi:hypothetical protein FLJC2902T_04490 [Flavobacterium limnosediminis JC2902]|uniref:Lipoprotein n=1 Tax=Flavobacterium limnosediminis JC2902 TaxID=1341181 RepID=V6SU18_9FLAO|nr:hypothetical protein [Flavobacterium limnosediminis]ESU29964.1 hypothetical protein FLJC2902T_04490 [Flavobacterium limnosediminis JC2902]
MKHFIFLISFMVFVSCVSQKQVPEKVTESIDEIYFQKWVAGVRGGGAGITFCVNFKTPLQVGTALNKVIFKGKEAVFTTQDGLHYMATIITIKGGKSSSDEEENNEVLPESNAAKLYFTVKGQSAVHALENVKEKEMLAYPSMNKERL